MKKQWKHFDFKRLHFCTFYRKVWKCCLKFDRLHLNLCSGSAALHTYQNRISTEPAPNNDKILIWGMTERFGERAHNCVIAGGSAQSGRGARGPVYTCESVKLRARKLRLILPERTSQSQIHRWRRSERARSFTRTNFSGQLRPIFIFTSWNKRDVSPKPKVRNHWLPGGCSASF